MKRIHFALLLILMSLFNVNCQKEFGKTGLGISETGNNAPAPITATLQGNILDENGQPAAGVAIKAGAKTATTNASGYFRIVNASLDKNASLVTAEKPGYFKAFRTFSATPAVNQVVIRLLKKISAGSIDGGSGGEITLSNEAKISLPANSVVKEQDGLPYTGSINVYASYIDPTASIIRETIPGSFMANDKNNKRVFLTSFGMMAVILESSSGEKLQIAKDKVAKLTIPVPSSIQSSAPSTISLWYVDEQTGLWKEEGVATKNGTTYSGEVKHFSFWNCDFSSPSVTLSLTIKNAKGHPVVYASVEVMSSSLGATYGYTDSLGQVSGLVPSNENLTLRVMDQCGSAIFSQNIGPLNENTNLGDITIGGTTSSIVTLEGKLLDCNNAPVTDGYAIIHFDNVVRYASTNSDGGFSTTFVICPASATTCEIMGVDNVTSQQGTVINTTVTAPATIAGNISACGASAAEFISFNLDGIDYNLAKPGTDSLFAYNTTEGQFFSTSIMGYKLNKGIDFNFTDNGAVGTFAINNLYVMGMNSIGLIQPFDVTLTSYPQNIGEFYEGSFSGQFRDSSNLTPLHTISCSFHVRK